MHPRRPLHVTVRVRPEVWSLRGRRTYRVIERALLSRPRTWMLDKGWMRAGGPIRLDEMPARS